MYVCQNDNHDGDRKIPEGRDRYEVGSETWCVDCTHAAMNPKLKRAIDFWQGRGLNAQDQGFIVGRI